MKNSEYIREYNVQGRQLPDSEKILNGNDVKTAGQWAKPETNSGPFLSSTYEEP